METAIAFVGAAAAALGAYELLSRLRGRPIRRLPAALEETAWPEMARLPAYAAPLATLLPDRFHPGYARGREQVLDLLRRAGYPYPTLGAFYAAAVLEFARTLLVVGAMGAALTMMGSGPAPVLVVGSLLIIRALRRPTARLRQLARERAAAFRANGVVGLSALHALLEAGVSPTEAMRRVGETVGGPFCNWLGFLAVRMETDESLGAALRTAEAHLPDPGDVEMRLLVQAIRDHFERGMPLAPAVAELREALRRAMVEETAARAARIRRQAGLAGFLANVGLVLAFILPVMAGGLLASMTGR